MRQDASFHPGEAVSQKVIARLLSEAFDRIVTVDPHLHRTHDLNDVFSTPVVQVSAAPLLGAAIAGNKSDRELVLVGPDEESRPWVEAAARITACFSLIGRKHRIADRTVEIEIEGAHHVRGKAAVLVDDVVSTGTTVRKVAHLLLDAGASSISLYATHMLSSTKDTRALNDAGIFRVVSTDSVKHPTNLIPLAPLLATALRESLPR